MSDVLKCLNNVFEYSDQTPIGLCVYKYRNYDVILVIVI